MSEERENLMYDLVDSLRLLGKIKWFLGDTTLSLEEFMILDLITESDDCTMKDIVTNFSIPASTATGIVDRLVKRKYVKRGKSKKDRRRVILSITTKGNKAFGEYRRSALIQMEESLSHLSKDEIHTLIDLVKKLTEGLGS